MRTILRLITVLATFGLVAACADMGETEKMSAKDGASGMHMMDMHMMHAKELTDGQKRLTGALGQGGTEKSPMHAATAQKHFDCWMKEAKAKQKKKAAACQSDFYGAMALLEADVWASPKMADAPKKMAKENGPPRTKHFLVFFDLESAAISKDEAKAVADAAKFAKANKGSNVYVTGHTDQAGSKKFNMALAKKRTDAVVANLTGMGVKKGAIGAVVQGENDPAVPRAGKKDSRNRRVVISIIY
ncbi:MAG: OmpA family protein [Proteobacteria bacterium]|nr:OmpA family protein [Pseudomonadota bacterium]